MNGHSPLWSNSREAYDRSKEEIKERKRDTQSTFSPREKTAMNFTNGILLGTTAAIVSLGSAGAADLPVNVKPVQYVKVCSLYGDGFYYIPGTDTCLKIGGYMRVQAEYNMGTGGGAIGNGSAGAGQARFAPDA